MKLRADWELQLKLTFERVILLLIVVWALLLALAAYSIVHAEPPKGVKISPELRQWYEGLEQPNNGGSCCSIADCRPVDSRVDANGHWEVFIGPQFNSSKQHIDQPHWQDVPDAVVLQHHENPEGRAVTCYLWGTIYCFVPPFMS